MDVLGIMKIELNRQCSFGLIAASDMEKTLPKRPPVLEDTQTMMERFWYSVQGFLIAAGNVSKILWPPDKKYEARGQQLRASLSIDDSSPIAPRTFRNHFEHFDERLEDWASSSRGVFVDSNIGSPRIGGVDPRDFLRNFDPSSFSLTFRGDRYSLRPIVEVMKNLRTKTETLPLP